VAPGCKSARPIKAADAEERGRRRPRPAAELERPLRLVNSRGPLSQKGPAGPRRLLNRFFGDIHEGLIFKKLFGFI